MAMSKSDPTTNEKFRNVVGHFLNTPPKPHKDMKKGKAKEKVNKNTDDKKSDSLTRRSFKDR